MSTEIRIALGTATVCSEHQYPEPWAQRCASGLPPSPSARRLRSSSTLSFRRTVRNEGAERALEPAFSAMRAACRRDRPLTAAAGAHVWRPVTTSTCYERRLMKSPISSPRISSPRSPHTSKTTTSGGTQHTSPPAVFVGKQEALELGGEPRAAIGGSEDEHCWALVGAGDRIAARHHHHAHQRR